MVTPKNLGLIRRLRRLTQIFMYLAFDKSLTQRVCLINGIACCLISANLRKSAHSANNCYFQVKSSGFFVSFPNNHHFSGSIQPKGNHQMPMLRNFVFISLLFYSSIVPAETPDYLAVNEEENRKTTVAGCRQATDQMLGIMKTTPPDTARDQERVGELIAKVEKMIDDNRRQGVDECRTWGEFNRLLVNF